jgi:phospholipid/cholesterol/gamma-HCH transport system permease protein
MPRATTPPTPFGPLAAPARAAAAMAGAIGYLGGLAILAASAVGALLRPGRGQPRITAVAARQAESLLIRGVPLIALLHVGFGSFLAMQAYFRATFAETNGAVVGVGLMRSVAPMLTCFALAALMGQRFAVEFAGGLRRGLDDEPGEVPDRDVVQGRAADSRPLPDVGRLVLARLMAALLVGPVLTLWGAAVGMFVGAAISRRMLGINSGTYFGFFFEMVQVPDVIGVLVLGMAYPGAACLIACHEALRAAPRGDEAIRAGIPATDAPAFRAMLGAVLAMLLLNSLWFGLAYLSGGPFGPTVVAGT